MVPDVWEKRRKDRGGRGRRAWFKKFWLLWLEQVRKETVGSLRLTGNVWPGWEENMFSSLLVDRKREHVSGSRRAASGGTRQRDPFSWLTQYLRCLFPLIHVSLANYWIISTQTENRIVSHLKVRFNVWRIESCLTHDFLLFQCQTHKPSKWDVVKGRSCSQPSAKRVCLIALILCSETLHFRQRFEHNWHFHANQI